MTISQKIVVSSQREKMLRKSGFWLSSRKIGNFENEDG